MTAQVVVGVLALRLPGLAAERRHEGAPVAWSTQELARLAGTTVNTIRHYHRLGLLDEPERRYNGYKIYEVSHLVRLLRIRRLVELGIPLAQVDSVANPGDDGATAALREVDAELAADIERLQRARHEIAEILEGAAPADAPAGFAGVAARMTEADRSIMHVLTRLYDEETLADLRDIVEADDDAVMAEIDALDPDADEATRARLAALLAVTIAQNYADYPWLTEPGSHFSINTRSAVQTLADAVIELYNPAQIDVFTRAALLAKEAADAPADDPLEGAS